MMTLRAVVIGILLFGEVCAQAPPPLSGSPAKPLRLTPCDDCVPGVINFARVDQTLWRGSQPSAEGFRNLSKLGVRTIVSFRHDHDDLPLLRGTQLKYLRIPSRAYRPGNENLARFLRLIQDPANGPVFIHCAQGRDRTGYNAAAYRMVLQGWSAEDAITEMKTFHFNKVWVGNPGFLRKLDVEELRRRAKALPAPEMATPEP